MADEAKQSGDVKRTKAESGAAVRLEDLTPTWTDKDGNVHRKRILTGDRTTGKLHLGHYVGSLRNRVKLQHEFDTFILLADVQALTTHWEKPEILRQSVMDVALDYMAVGLLPYDGTGADDGTRVKLVIQSMVPAIAELTVYYGLVTPMSLLTMNPTTKAEAEQHGMAIDNQGKKPSVIAATGGVHIGGPLKIEGGIRIATGPEWHRLKAILENEYAELGELSFDELLDAETNVESDSNVSIQEVLKKRKPKEPHAAIYLEHVTLRRQLRDCVIRDRRQKGLSAMTYGFLGYPVSQAADITFVNAHLVPVGEDQLPHIELTREIARRMNKQYGGRSRLLVEPQALIGGTTLKALDGSAKMSKSLGNAIYLSDSDEEIWGQLKRAVTDPQRMRRDDPGRPEICNVFAYHQQFNEETEPAIKDAGLNVPTVPETAELCKSAGIGCVDCKKNLAAKLKTMLDPIRERRVEWEKRPGDLKDVLLEGTRRGAEEGEITLARLRQAMKLDYWS